MTTILKNNLNFKSMYLIYKVYVVLDSILVPDCITQFKAQDNRRLVENLPD